MALTLTVINEASSRLGDKASHRWFDRGGTLGRAPNNDWVLPDPTMEISRCHARIRYQDGRYFLEDSSANGILLADGMTRLDPAEPLPLQDGVEFLIGDCRIRARIEAEAVVPPPAPEPPLPGNPADNDVPDPLALLGGAVETPSTAPKEPPSGHSYLNEHFSAPRFTETPPRVEPPEPTPIATPAPSPQAPANQAPSNQAPSNQAPSSQVPSNKPPSSQPPSRDAPSEPLLPEDWWRDLPDGGSPQPQPPPQPQAQPQPGDPGRDPGGLETPPEAPPMTEARPGPVDEPPPAAQPMPEARPGPVDETPPAARPIPETAARGGPADEPPPAARPIPETAARGGQADESPPAAQPIPETAARGGQADESPPAAQPIPGTRASQADEAPPAGGRPDQALRQLLSGAGLDPDRVPPEQAEELGRILRVAIQGVMDLLKARMEVKNEFRMSVTLIQARENNPLKFSTSPEDALHNLMVKQNPDYLPAVEAFEAGFEDLRFHQLAMLAGMRSGFFEMLHQFDPAHLEARFAEHEERASLLGRVTGPRYWRQYQAHYAAIQRDSEGYFNRLFGEAFCDAYEKQIQALKARSSQGRG